MDTVNEDMKVAGVWGEDAEDMIRWRKLIRYGDPWKKRPKGKEEEEIGTQKLRVKVKRLKGLMLIIKKYRWAQEPQTSSKSEQPQNKAC